MTHETDNLDPFAFGGRRDDDELDDEIIVDEEGKALLALVDAEPILGPLARELFEIDEELGNIRGGPLAEPERWEALSQRQNVVWRGTETTPAETIGGLALAACSNQDPDAGLDHVAGLD
jgi:hypothetical protein